MVRLQEIPVTPLPIERFLPLVGETAIRELERSARILTARFPGRIYWNINSTARGGGVAEMLHPIIAYARGLGGDLRWLAIQGSPEFFRITKRLHHALHGSVGDGSALGAAERVVYERVLQENAHELERLVRPYDLVILHDPQSAGLAPALVRTGARVIWRCHIGSDIQNEHVDLGWAFIRPYLRQVEAGVFSRASFIPAWCPRGRTAVVPPSIDPFSPKNQELDEATVRAILVQSGLVEGPPGEGGPVFVRGDGTVGRVDRQAEVIRLGRAPTWETPLVVAISRWDPLKDHLGVMRGFADSVAGVVPDGVQLVLAGPDVRGVTDDPEGAATLERVIAAWRSLPDAARSRIQLVSLPMTDADENAAMVNALQRHATVVVQKSLCEGFGLTVTEAMWKARPIVASAVGGIQDQIEHGFHGLLLPDPTDLRAYGRALRRLLEDRPYAEQLGQQAYERVRDQFLPVRHILQYVELIAHEGGPPPRPLEARSTPGTAGSGQPGTLAQPGC